MNLQDLLPALRRDGAYLCGPCPWCGGTDRFVVDKTRTRWICRACSPRYGDAISFVRRSEGVGYLEACRYLKLDPADPRAGETMREISAVAEPAESDLVWWMDLLDTAEALLWQPVGKNALNWLRARGLHDDTIRSHRLGHLPSDNPAKRSITIPWILSSRLWGASQRTAGHPKYRELRGSVRSLFGADNLPGKNIAVLTEGEFDCMLLAQEAGDLVGVATLGSASARSLHPEAISRLLSFPLILVCYDSDEAGNAGAAALGRISARFRPVQVPKGNDITDFHRSGGNLRQWVRYLLDQHQPGIGIVAQVAHSGATSNNFSSSAHHEAKFHDNAPLAPLAPLSRDEVAF